MSQEKMKLPVGAIVRDMQGERYSVEGLLGRGGSGAVYLVRNRHAMKYTFALKEIIDPSNQDRKRLRFECEVLQRLEHRALPRVYHVFGNEKLNRVYLLMEYIKGRNLEDLRKEQPGRRFTLDLALSIMTPVVDALIYMHSQDPPVVHRDIKPGNIIMPLDGGEAVLVDFGTAKEYLPEATTTNFRHGSPGYAPIEQYGGGSGTDLRTDIYGLGATFYTLLTGTIPIDAIARMTSEKEGDPLQPVRALVPDIPIHVSIAVQRAMSPHKKDRFASVEAFWRALHVGTAEEPYSQAASPQELLPTASSSMRTEIKRQPARSIGRRGRTLFIALALVIILTSGLALFFYAPWSPAHRTPPVTTSRPDARSTQTPAPVLSGYPSLAPSYSGTISDISVAHTKTIMYLTGIQQDRDHIHGSFQGLGLVGPFTGTVTSAGNIRFTVNIYSNNTTLIFDGAIKIGGDLTGSFNVFNSNGQSTGEYGLWYISTISS